MKSTRLIFLIAGLGVLIGVGAVLYVVFLAPGHIELSGRSLTDILHSEDFPPLLIVIFSLGITLLATLPFLRLLFPRNIRNGVAAAAKVLKVWDTGVSVNDNPQVGLLLEVIQPGGSLIQVEAKTLVSRLNAALVQPGISAEVIYDPHKPQRLQVISLDIQPAASDGGTERRLRELEELRDKGLVTAEEYARKREEILKAL